MAIKNRPDGALTAFFSTRGEHRAVAGNRPIQLNDSGLVWFVEEGAIDILATELADGRIEAPYRHIARLEKGRLAFGVANSEHSMLLVAKGVQATSLRCLPLGRVLEETVRASEAKGALPAAVIAQLDAWVEDLAHAVATEVENPPRIEGWLGPGSEAAHGVSAAERGVVWLSAARLDATFLDVVDSRSGSPGLMPVTRDSWIKLHATSGVACRSSRELGVKVLLDAGLPEFHRLALGAESIHRRLLLVDDANLQVAQADLRRREKSLARKGLADLLDFRTQSKGHTALGKALRIIGAREGLEILTPAVSGETQASLDDYCEASGLRRRDVRLTVEDRWWLGDSGAMLAFRRHNDQPVVLMPGLFGRYRVMDPETGEAVPANARSGAELRDACLLYPALSTHGPASMGALLRVGAAPMTAEILRLTAFGLGAGLLALAPAIAVNLLVDHVIPAGESIVVFQFSAVLTGIALTAALARVLRGIALMRLEGRLAARIGAAVQDRLLRMRLRFFRRFNTGELVARSMVFQDVRDNVAGVTVDAALSTMFALPALAMIFLYDAVLGWTATALTFVVLAVTAGYCGRMVEHHRHYLRSSRQLLGELHQFLSGIGKLRTTGAEDMAFAAWARRYREQKHEEIRQAVLNEWIVAMVAAVPFLGSAALFSAVVAQGADGLATADFLTVHTAAMFLFMTLVMLGNSARSLAFVKPACEQVQPILAAETDVSTARGVRKTLHGEILLDKVSFGYSENATILRDVSIHAKPGEFIAIVGESGAGKSTLFRLGLGLERPNAGAVYFDGQSLDQFDIVAVRRQIGVVTQDVLLQSGTILDNIIGHDTELNEEDAWRAAGLAGVDEDIRAMPMGLHTPVDENATTFSGGQSQRIRIAAALIRNPRIIFLDEPTSWLDTRSQTRTMRAIEESTSTRLVVAHRLSTIRRANRIYVLQAGQVSQVGSYDELAAEEGLFRELVQRQQA
ncbi:MAG: ATP-binding cassette domain-containing protein [Defluviicoccus sp.]|nr:ATP-binding cassette domain-containing protein [Gammaproteobacteria bacterium]MDE0275576.1 ATP-binding cassette domain-containing protein [Defluviicoccus sp.]